VNDVLLVLASVPGAQLGSSDESDGKGAKRPPWSASDNGGLFRLPAGKPPGGQERVKGFEPSTFTLASPPQAIGKSVNNAVSHVKRNPLHNHLHKESRVLFTVAKPRTNCRDDLNEQRCIDLLQT
jgi:hypothetical protein